MILRLVTARRIVVAILLIFAGYTCAAQQPAPLITNVEHRSTISLNGPWHAIVDMYDTGYREYQTLQPSSDAGFFRNAKQKNKSDLVEYDFDKSESLTVPSDWNSQRESLLFYEDTVWYEKSFSYPKKPNTRVFLYVGAANYFSRVGVNGQVLCSHEGGFTPFNCEITSALRDGENFVVIYVNNARKREGVPTVNTDWWNYGGLTRDVSLVEVPQAFIQDYFIQLKPHSRDQIAGWVKLSDMVADQRVTVRIPELSIEKTFITDKNGVANVALFVSQLKLWSPEQPKLYLIEIESGADKLKDDIGFRSIEVRGRDILLNGSPVFLRGVSIHEEAPYRPGRAYSEGDDKTLLGWAKDLGANFVRLAHYPHNEHMLRMADRMGLMVWSEVPVYWGIQWENPATLANAENQLTDSITRDKNRASIVIWSVGNETPVSDARNKFLRSMVQTARKLDSTRLISAALQIHKHEGATRVLDDPLGADLDVLGCNEYIGWYEGSIEDIDSAAWQTPYNKPLIMSEFGGGALSGFHADADTRFSEEYQEKLYQHQTAMLDHISFLRGTTPWVLMDFRSPRRLLPGIQDYYNRKGLVSKQGDKKKAFFVLQKWYEQKK
ncbi:MAG TPA: glycoside hydrolase family 2 TIM barrel-domain containing protein [Terriglobales bacterium]|nr:glycoside hydrolase family 2 TIM barrel-domain containing protein [Terriglobales bacterium]